MTTSPLSFSPDCPTTKPTGLSGSELLPCRALYNVTKPTRLPLKHRELSRIRFGRNPTQRLENDADGH